MPRGQEYRVWEGKQAETAWEQPCAPLHAAPSFQGPADSPKAGIPSAWVQAIYKGAGLWPALPPFPHQPAWHPAAASAFRGLRASLGSKSSRCLQFCSGGETEA